MSVRKAALTRGLSPFLAVNCRGSGVSRALNRPVFPRARERLASSCQGAIIEVLVTGMGEEAVARERLLLFIPFQRSQSELLGVLLADIPDDGPGQ